MAIFFKILFTSLVADFKNALLSRGGRHPTKDSQLPPAAEPLNADDAVLTFLGFGFCVYSFYLDKVREKDVAKSSLLSAF